MFWFQTFGFRQDRQTDGQTDRRNKYVLGLPCFKKLSSELVLKPATIKKPAAPKKPVTPKKPAAPKKAVAKVTKKQKNKYVA